ncbi:initiator tRNA phosphoribosyl transferase [Acaromyces ingoldii]|uniref:Initiator tRNA phosphoribosyl transferase n=1 Tax=Acaromyces ingoldii TaxID=215250 RepID=A0A316YLH7_9BASI|nr:initiator tRNA phosphoribosyl transferase [Acaromyces ingoldii]PWN90042.1 initiator tRNA phosphoribosyl transferase [Acaromyces ingoldii]
MDGEGELEQRIDARKEVRKAERDPWNRLNSIVQDAEWVSSIASSLFPYLPTVANLRCGAWYLPSMERGCYFKSTDGHTHQWAFSLKRYNLPLLELILARGGCVVVDSTRRGKSLPDALSKTLPIWCAVLNRASSRRYGCPATAETCRLKTPKDVVSPSEHAQIEDRVEGWVEALLQSDLPIVKLDKPLRPLFVTPSRIDEEEKDVYPVVALSASVMVDDTPELVSLSPSQHCALQRRVQAQTQPRRTDDDDKLQRVELIDRQFIYVQGSGDDEEAWAQGLTPSLFWQRDNLEAILASGGPEQCQCILRDIEAKSKGLTAIRLDEEQGDTNVKGTPLFLGRRIQGHAFSKGEKDRFDVIFFMDDTPSVSDEEEEETNAEQIHRLGLQPGKRGLNGFRAVLEAWLPRIQRQLVDQRCKGILFCSTDADKHADLAASFAIAVLARCFDASRELIARGEREIGKDDVRRRMQWLVTDVPWSNPSRSHLLRVNQVLLSPGHRPSCNASS